ncbi:MAG: hypothetical protein ACKV2T_37960 [Kofleriaceae bacterium]
MKKASKNVAAVQPTSLVGISCANVNALAFVRDLGAMITLRGFANDFHNRRRHRARG